mmetsp:Transcript_60667/g.195468  ORF Transcript_60667/g.195468 Transcript_60667/m.195468 type:complete len:484 (-) Transcript_60667:93-1544(-)
MVEMPCFICADTPVSEVRTSVEGLSGPAREAALAAASSLQSARDLGSLDRQLRAATVQLATAAPREAVAFQVSPGPRRGCLFVALRPQPGPRAAADAGLNAQLEPALSLRVEQVLPTEGVQPPLRLGLNGIAGLSRDALACMLRATPMGLSMLGSSLAMSFEVGAGGANFMRPRTPYQRSQLAALTFAGPLGRHSMRLEAASRELIPDEGASEAALAGPLQSTKASLGYQFLRDTRKGAAGEGELRKASLEVAGLLGDVALAKAEGVWTCSRRALGGTLGLSAAAGLAVPLGLPGTAPATPWEERFFLGGAAGGPAERLPGFASRGVGPTDPRRVPPAAAEAAACAGPPKTVWRFGQDWSTQTAEVPASAAAGARIQVATDHIGGDAHASAGAALQWPLPLPPLGGLRLHGLLFGAAGTLVDKVRPSLLQDLRQQVRASVGLALGTPLPGGGFLGLAWAQPMLARQGDTQQRMQLWLTMGSLL